MITTDEIEFILSKKPILDLDPKMISDKIADRLDTIPANTPVWDAYGTFAKMFYDSGDLYQMKFGSRLSVYALHLQILPKYPTFSSMITSSIGTLFSEEVLDFVMKHEDELNDMVDIEVDYTYNIMAIEGYKSTYILRKNNEMIEIPQYVLLRTAIGLWYNASAIEEKDDVNNMNKIRETYELERSLYFTHATPIKANSLCKNNCLISCFIQKLKSDSIRGIGKTMDRTMMMQKANAGVATSMHNIRPTGDIIGSSGRICDGIEKPLQIFNEIAKYVDQNKKRPGAHAITLAAYHPDIFNFATMKDQFAPAGKGAKDLFYAVWCDQLFLDAVVDGSSWYLMSPHHYNGLEAVYGEKFNELYLSYVEEAENSGKLYEYEDFHRELYKHKGVLADKVLKLPARKLFYHLIKCQVATGLPYIMNKTLINSASNSTTIIESSNLCCEITLPFDENTTAVCCLSSIKISEFAPCLTSRPTFDEIVKIFDWTKLKKVVGIIVHNLNRVLEINSYPTKETEKGAREYLPIGVGTQDLSYLFMKLHIPFTSPEAAKLNIKIQQFIYYYALSESIKLAKIHGPYPKYSTSRFAQGLLQFDLHPDFDYSILDSSLNWDNLRYELSVHGCRNHTLLANMPTAGTSTVVGSYIEAQEPCTSVYSTRKLGKSEILIIPEKFQLDLMREGIYNAELSEKIRLADGRICEIGEISQELRDIYATVYDFGMKPVIDHYKDRQPFVCQSQSMNIFLDDININTISSMYFYIIGRGLKTLCYYFRGKASIGAAKNKVVDVECKSCSG